MSLAALRRPTLRSSGFRRFGRPALSPDDKLIAAIDTTGAVVHVWDAGSRREPLEVHRRELIELGRERVGDGIGRDQEHADPQRGVESFEAR